MDDYRSPDNAWKPHGYGTHKASESNGSFTNHKFSRIFWYRQHTPLSLYSTHTVTSTSTTVTAKSARRSSPQPAQNDQRLNPDISPPTYPQKLSLSLPSICLLFLEPLSRTKLRQTTIPFTQRWQIFVTSAIEPMPQPRQSRGAQNMPLASPPSHHCTSPQQQ
jgi:hypothetical protein